MKCERNFTFHGLTGEADIESGGGRGDEAPWAEVGEIRLYDKSGKQLPQEVVDAFEEIAMDELLEAAEMGDKE